MPSEARRVDLHAARRNPLVVYGLLVPLLCRAASPDVDAQLPASGIVVARELEGTGDGRGLALTFPRSRADPSLGRFSQEEARQVVKMLEDEFGGGTPKHTLHLLEQPLLSAVLAGSGSAPPTTDPASDWEKKIRERYESLYGPSSIPLPASLESSRWFQALRLSPRYMGDGVREAAIELLSSPSVAMSVAMSMMLYMVAWAAPEPLFSKAFAASVTLGLLMTYTLSELRTVGVACLSLYQEAESARTVEQMDAAAERFGKALGGVGLRVLVTIATARLSSKLPEIPKGGLWGRLSPPRFSFSGRGGALSLGSGSRAQVVANGTVVLMGVSAATTAQAVSATVSKARTSGGCREDSNRGDAKEHHIATNKNDISGARGGPWTPRFIKFFNRAGMSLDDPANKIYLLGHQGPHPEEYHQEVYDRLEDALGNCQALDDCRRALIDGLDKIAADICKPGSRLNLFTTRKP